MRWLVLVVVLCGCGGREETSTTCVATSESRDCSSGDVLLFSEATDDAGATTGTMTTCKTSCIVGSACTFPTASGYVDGVCK